MTNSQPVLDAYGESPAGPSELAIGYARWAVWLNALAGVIGIGMLVAALALIGSPTWISVVIGLVLATFGSVIAGFSFWSVAEAVSGQPVIIMNAYGLLPGRGARPILGWHEIRRIRTVIVKGNGVTDVRFLIEARDLDAVKRRASSKIRLKMAFSRVFMGSAIAISTIGSSASPADVGAILARHYRGEWIAD
jgi:hypothetical protein